MNKCPWIRINLLLLSCPLWVLFCARPAFPNVEFSKYLGATDKKLTDMKKEHERLGKSFSTLKQSFAPSDSSGNNDLATLIQSSAQVEGLTLAEGALWGLQVAERLRELGAKSEKLLMALGPEKKELQAWTNSALECADKATILLKTLERSIQLTRQISLYPDLNSNIPLLLEQSKELAILASSQAHGRLDELASALSKFEEKSKAMEGGLRYLSHLTGKKGVRSLAKDLVKLQDNHSIHAHRDIQDLRDILTPSETQISALYYKAQVLAKNKERGLTDYFDDASLNHLETAMIREIQETLAGPMSKSQSGWQQKMDQMETIAVTLKKAGDEKDHKLALQPLDELHDLLSQKGATTKTLVPLMNMVREAHRAAFMRDSIRELLKYITNNPKISPESIRMIRKLSNQDNMNQLDRIAMHLILQGEIIRKMFDIKMTKNQVESLKAISLNNMKKLLDLSNEGALKSTELRDIRDHLSEGHYFKKSDWAMSFRNEETEALHKLYDMTEASIAFKKAILAMSDQLLKNLDKRVKMATEYANKTKEAFQLTLSRFNLKDEPNLVAKIKKNPNCGSINEERQKYILSQDQLRDIFASFIIVKKVRDNLVKEDAVLFTPTEESNDDAESD